jgi:tetratricopeptide (TPR) repeat protein
MNLKTGIALVLFLLIGITAVNAQDKYGKEPDKCKNNLSIFYEYAKVGNFAQAYEPWEWCINNCPTSSKNLYKYGIIMLNDKYEKSTDPAETQRISNEIDKIYQMRVKHFPDNLGKVYSDWANSLVRRDVPPEEVFKKLSQSFKADPAGMSVKNLAKYFEMFTEKNKDINPQLVFDTYDDITEAVAKKMDAYSKYLDKLNAKEASGKTLTAKEKRKKHAAEVNLTALGQVEGFLDQTLSEIATCERLIPLYKGTYEKHKTDASWLRRSVSRLNQKGCTEDPLYPTLVELYVNAAPSPTAYVFYAGILMDKGENNKAVEYFKKAIDIEKDPYKRANLYYNLAKIYQKKGQKGKARELARKAISERPSFGHAYLLISSLYASSANSCGTDEFSKRMVYVAAVDKARRAKSVDPGITSLANKYIKSYMASAPSKKLVFTEGKTSGTPYKIGCWIGETVKIP